ncbi:MAG: SelB C-terminal domain-containing protein [Candidatus Aminicenantaceae bacterium]
MTKTRSFDAVIDFSAGGKPEKKSVHIRFQKRKFSASLYFYNGDKKNRKETFFVKVYSSLPLILKWKDKFSIFSIKEKKYLGEGRVLNPFSEKVKKGKTQKRIHFLKELCGSKKDMLFALALRKGIHGLREREINKFYAFNKKSLNILSQSLEGEGKVKIISFIPIFLITHESFEFLKEKILNFIGQFQKKSPHVSGVSFKKIKDRFNISRRVLNLAVNHLCIEGSLKEDKGFFSLASFKKTMTSSEKKILNELEEMFLKGEFYSVSLKQLKKRFRISSEKLDYLISILTEEKKVVYGKDGFFVSSQWLDEIIHEIKKSGKKEIKVADFKEMTGLTRKYAIPLLELLDQMKVTRRKGAVHEIID